MDVGSGEGVFAESPNRVFILQRGELPNIERPKTIKLPQLGPNIEFPIGRLPWRDATSASPPGALEVNGKVGDDPTSAKPASISAGSTSSTSSTRNGNIIEDWTQWDKMFRRPHAVYISPYDPEKNVWIVDDYRHAMFKFTQRRQEAAADDRRAERARRRRQALLPADVHGVAAGRHLLRRRRLREHARREVRQERQVPDWRGARRATPRE